MSTFEQYLNIRYATAPSFRSDGGRLAFLTDITGTAQLWTLDAPQQWPEQLTFFADRLTFAQYSPTDPIIAFGRDAGGDENELVFLIDDVGGVPRQASVKQAKHIWGGFSPDGKLLAWSHNGRNGRDFDVYVYDIAAGTERLVCEADGYMWVSSWGHGSDELFVCHAASNDNSDIYRVRIGSAPELLTKHAGKAVYARPLPSRTSNTCLIATNADHEFTTLAELDLDSKSVRPLSDEIWDIEAFAQSEDERWRVEVRNRDGYSRALVFDRDARNAEPKPLDLPVGITGSVKFVGASSTIVLTHAGVTDTTDIWTADAATGAAERWTRSATGGVPRTSFIGPELVTYSSFDDLEISAYFWKPPGPGPFPVVIDIHGGPEGQRRPGLSALAQYYLERGIATLAPNVRGSSGYGKTFMALDDVRKRMDSVADIRAAHDWLVAGVADPERIALYGGSYGGFMVLSAMVTYPDLWAAGVDIVGIANFVTFLENTSEYRRHLRESEYGSLEHDREFLHSISPLTHIDNIAAPLMVVHGRNDPRVPVSEAEQVIAACRAKGLPVEALIYEDEGHGLAKRKNRLDAAPKILDFLVRHLRL